MLDRSYVVPIDVHVHCVVCAATMGATRATAATAARIPQNSCESKEGSQWQELGRQRVKLCSHGLLSEFGLRSAAIVGAHTVRHATHTAQDERDSK
jgi:hypothetical protein